MNPWGEERWAAAGGLSAQDIRFGSVERTTCGLSARADWLGGTRYLSDWTGPHPSFGRSRPLYSRGPLGGTARKLSGYDRTSANWPDPEVEKPLPCQGGGRRFRIPSSVQSGAGERVAQLMNRMRGCFSTLSGRTLRITRVPASRRPGVPVSRTPGLPACRAGERGQTMSRRDGLRQ
jgi:hypothetical protein